MAVPVQYVAVKPSLCAVYSQNWQIPNPATSITQRNFFHSGRSLNKDWIRGRVKHIPHDYRQNSTEKARTKNVRVKSASPLRSASADMFLESREDEINDTVKEFKLTLQLFKRLTQQVRDVNQCMNQQRIYSFKHHMNNEGIASPALRRSQLAAAMSKREIPATEAPYEPCNDLGPTCASYMTRPCSRHERAASSPVPIPRPSSSTPPSRTTSPSPTLRPSSRTNTKRTTAERTADPKKLQHDLAEADAKARVEWEESDPHFEELFVPEELELDDLGFKFHDPYPETWVEETVEDACFRGTKKTDPFMHRLKELENLKEETVLWEIYREEKAKQSADAASSSRGSSHKFSRLSSGAASHPRTQSAKVVAPQLYRGKSAVNRLRRTSSAGKGSLSNQTISASDEGSDSVQTFRNSGYQLGISFVPGSLYPEARPPPKPRAKSPNGEKSSKKVRNASASANTQTNDNKKTLVPKSPPCEACNPRPVVSPRSTLPRSVATSAHALRSQYALKASECYDIVELARTFDPPCKAHFVKAKAKQTGSGVDNSLVKGISPGKSYFSQRRISLTRMTLDESMTVRGVSPQNMTRPSTGRCKSAKKGPKKR